MAEGSPVFQYKYLSESSLFNYCYFAVAVPPGVIENAYSFTENLSGKNKKIETEIESGLSNELNERAHELTSEVGAFKTE